MTQSDQPTSSPRGNLSDLPTVEGRPGSFVEDAALLQETPGTKIGPYRIVQLIGEGGFGSVFMAQQESPVVRTVALKIIKLGMDTRQVVARFEQERQALALMDHPSIARVLDAGVTETGRPYFVMDLVKGDPIAEYCDKNSLSIADRLELFSQVCAAVQHAHSKGIIHRDLKPSNVLVSSQDGKAVAKVIDFGIAKATNSRLSQQTFFTEHKQLIGTPEYMSPEQAEGSMDIDTRSDVYSLGVLLYELLTGSTPFSSKELRSAAYAEVQRIIREKDPPKPSTRLSQPTVSISEVAARRRIEPKRLSTAIRGELDWIVMKAMEKDRSRRYETANGLAMDIRRYLSGEAVMAAPPGAGYRMRKFIRRNRGAAIAAGVVAAALVLGVVGTSIGMVEARRERKAADASAARAAEEAARATKAESVAQSRLAESEATVAFLDTMLGAVDPAAQGKDVTVRKVLDNASKSVGERFADKPLIAARLHGTIGRTYLSLGVYDQSESHIREQLRLRTEQLGPDAPDTRIAANDLGLFLIKQGKQAEAEKHLKDAIATNERLFGRKHEITVQSLDLLAQVYVDQMQGAQAEPLLREVLATRTATLGTSNDTTLAAMNSLATLCADTGRFDESEKLFTEALSLYTKLHGPEHPYTLEIQGNLAWMEYWAGAAVRKSDPADYQRRMQLAKTLGEKTLEARTRVLGEEHPTTSTAMANLSSVYNDLGMFDEAEAMRRKDLEITLRTLGEDHPDAIVSLANFGAMLRRRGKCAEALSYFERAMSATKRAKIPENQGLGFTLGWYGSCLGDLSRFAEGEKALLEGESIVVRTMGADHDIAKTMALDVAKLYEGWEKAEPGKGYAAKAVEWRAKATAK